MQPLMNTGDRFFRARQLAMCVLDNVGGLDDGAFEGLIEFIRESRVRPGAARSAIGG